MPPAAPLIVPGRAAQDAMGAGEVAISIALMVVSTVLLMRMAARIYERSILRVGAPLKVVQAWRLARQPQA